MAHPKRKEWAEELSKQLDCPVYWDTDNTVWNTCKGAWGLADKDSDYHFVIQDDAILCKDFKNTVKKFVEKTLKKHQNVSFQLYVGKGRGLDKVKNIMTKDYAILPNNMWGVAIGLPTKLIDEMIRFGNNYFAWQDDTKIKYFLKSKGMQTVFPVPCFVDHRIEATTLTPCVDFDKSSDCFIDKQKIKETIPKILHQIWIGDASKMPTELMQTWQNMKGWTYKLWTEKDIDELGLKNRKLYDYFYNKGCYYGASDVVRIEILERFGGLYIDADSKRLENIDELMNCSFLSVYSNTEGRIANGVMGAIKNHPIISNYIIEMGKARTVEPVWSTIGGTLFTEMILKYQDDRTSLLKPITFYPFDSKGVKCFGHGKTYSRHFWKSTHRTY